MYPRTAVAVVVTVSSVLSALLVQTSVAARETSAAAPAARLVAVDRAQQAGYGGPLRETYGAVPLDYNRDGRQDVWVGWHSDGAAMFRNNGQGRYARVARTTWPRGTRADGHIDRHDCAWADVDRNGLPDAYCSTGRMLVNVVKRGKDNELWLQVRRGDFREVGTAWGVGDRCGRGRDVEFLDVNGDRFPDLFLGNETPRDDPGDPCNAPGNHLPNEAGKVFINRHGNGFRYAPEVWHFGAGIGSRCAVALDYNRDGRDDLLACEDRNEPAHLYRNVRGHFVDVTSRHHLGNLINDAMVADLDRDGDADIVTAAADGFAYHPFAGGVFGERVLLGSVPVGQGGSVAVGDADGDGDNDVYGLGWVRSNGNPDDVLLINRAMTFTAIPVPPSRGSGDEAVALRPHAKGRKTLFLVLNGHVFGHSPATFEPGRTQLITVVRR
jgi:hypothetical protein